MLKVASFDIVFQEIPGEVTLALNLSGCPCHCKGCHSPHLWEDIGEPLTADLLDNLIARYAGLITCVCFMGGDQDPAEVLRLAEHVKSYFSTSSTSLSSFPSLEGRAGERFERLHTAWYSGRNRELPSYGEGLEKGFDYIKIGPYIESLGGLKSPTTNQRLYKREGDIWQDITPLFWKNRFDSL